MTSLCSRPSHTFLFLLQWTNPREESHRIAVLSLTSTRLLSSSLWCKFECIHSENDRPLIKFALVERNQDMQTFLASPASITLGIFTCIFCRGWGSSLCTRKYDAHCRIFRVFHSGCDLLNIDRAISIEIAIWLQILFPFGHQLVYSNQWNMIVF
jgi:hypothetical protein